MISKFYKQTELEHWIQKQYQPNGILYASDLDIDHIASIFGVEIRLYQGPSFAEWKENEYSFVFINSNLTEEQRREQFFHELCHPVQHVGRQENMPLTFIELQEIQAAHFQLYAAMPIYMLEEFKGISDRQTYINILSREFKLTAPFVQKRVDQIERRICQGRIDKRFTLKNKTVPVRYNYSPETTRILDKLQRLKSMKRPYR
jgi:Zn-dependent peptidase ImmA (M78 family)